MAQQGYPPIHGQGYPSAQPVQGGYPSAQPVQGGYPSAQPVQGAYPAAVPVYTQPGPVAPSEWQAGLCEWYKDFGLCIVTCCCPCITFGQTAEIIDNGITSCASAAAICFLIQAVAGCGCLYSCGFRSKLRAKFGLPASPCNDCCTHWCCSCCAFIQEYRELKLRGFDPSKGYQASAPQQAMVQQVPMQQYMQK
eukprot:TRINITY_DN62_c0_g1_i1.p1 TRINITY_DN62_c0_g1~~TRINITY_DN62_c0_g1_i1.p1  ORF type:complete len:194 (+),score=20.18 TRINITY_DN62_c0_g1_i1:88-669(+)